MINDYIEEADIEETQVEIERLITFNLENEKYGVEVNKVREILRVNQSFPVPGAPEFVLGITNIRGNVVTIIDARMRFNLPYIEYTDAARMIVVESQQETVAVIVDSVSDVIDVPKSDIEENMGDNFNGDSRFVSGVVTCCDGLIILLDVEKIITEEQFDIAAGF